MNLIIRIEDQYLKPKLFTSWKSKTNAKTCEIVTKTVRNLLDNNLKSVIFGLFNLYKYWYVMYWYFMLRNFVFEFSFSNFEFQIDFIVD